MAFDRCRICRQRLEPGPMQDRAAESATWKVAIRGIPTRRCPQGCQGLFWFDPNFGVEVFDMLVADTDSVARRKGLFRTRQLCRMCGAELGRTPQPGSVSVGGRLRSGSLLEIRIEGPLLRCEVCRRDYLPAQLAGWDPVHRELDDLISGAATRDLIWR
jgi:uncharacterized protein with PIN domain